jgi:hypothetical protein
MKTRKRQTMNDKLYLRTEMFNDRESDDHEDNFEDEQLKMQMKHIEEEFFSTLKSGKDISIFLYLPFELLSQKVKDELDKYLIEQAYVNIFIKKSSSDVYHDGFVQIGVDDENYRLTILQKMLPYFTEKEEYEKCVNIRDLITKLQNKK